MTTHKLIKKLTANAQNEKPLMSSKRPAMELQINRAIGKERVMRIVRHGNIAGINYNF